LPPAPRLKPEKPAPSLTALLRCHLAAGNAAVLFIHASGLWPVRNGVFMTLNRIHVAACAAASCLGWAFAAHAQTQTEPATVVITGNPLRSSTVDTPASVLTGPELLLRRGSTLGDTLAGTPGVAQSHFGPNASRPIIRGQDGDRIRILGNSGAGLDASSLSADHAVPIDPLAIERIEVLRGPAALLYGGSAAGGVVNVIDNRIPQRAVGPLQAVTELRLGGAARERGGAAVLELDAAGLAWHVDGFTRRTSALEVPAFNHPSSEVRRRVVNSDAQAEGGAIGASFVGNQGHLGLSWDTYRSRYGTVVEEAVRIRMQRDKLSVAGEWRGGPQAWLQVLRGQASSQDYEHLELEDGAVGTTFRNRGHEARVEATHRAHALGGGQLQGAFGAQLEDTRFSALGDEAFVPSTRTQQRGLFAVETWTLPNQSRYSVGLRRDTVTVASAGDEPGAPEPRFGAAQTRDFSPVNASLGGAWPVGERWLVTANLARTQRAPVSYELFANGLHVATAVVERGDAGHTLERGRSRDVGLQWRHAGGLFKLAAFDNRYANYLVLLPTGEPDVVSDEGDAFPVQAFRGVTARLRGGEVEARQRFQQGGLLWEVGAQADTVRGLNVSQGEPLPRLAPWSARAHVHLTWGALQLRTEVQHAARQARVPRGDTATPAWTQWHLSGLWNWQAAPFKGQFFLRGTNLTDALALNAASAATVRGLSPLGGRALQAGLRVNL
jgi:iron complex outermembrane recepter protein